MMINAMGAANAYALAARVSAEADDDRLRGRRARSQVLEQTATLIEEHADAILPRDEN